MNVPRILIAAPSSGSGKTLITCGILGLLKKKGRRVASFKCGPDFIDPMFHTKVIGTKSRNLDLFFTDPVTTRYLLRKNAADCDIAVMEGVMGYYDGISIDSSKGGASDLAAVTDTPVILVVDAAGVSRSLLALIRGFLDFQEKPMIRGIILNRLSPSLYPSMKELIERELFVSVLGYVPVLKDCVLESRHLGLMMPDEIHELKEKLERLTEQLEKTLETDRILALADSAPALSEDSRIPTPEVRGLSRPLRIGLARDEAFCFFYEDNLELLREMGAELVEFSPIHDTHLPEQLDGLLLHGGYPELYLKELSENHSMLTSVRSALTAGLPCMAECGGFLYLHETLQNPEGEERGMVGFLPGKAWYTGRLTRFGYITLKEGEVFGRQVGPVRAHEFHYFESEDPGDRFLAEKPSGKRSWRCIRRVSNVLTGFPHFYYYANPEVPRAFLEFCAERTKTCSN